MVRWVSGLLSLVFIAACSRDATAPTSAITGSFGGRGTELVATNQSVRVQFVCGFARFAQPIVPGPDGRFSLSPVLVQSSSGTVAVAIKGVVRPGQIEFDTVSLFSSGDVATAHHLVHLNQPADYSGMACSADG
jgi:hypothetical protein